MKLVTAAALVVGDCRSKMSGHQFCRDVFPVGVAKDNKKGVNLYVGRNTRFAREPGVCGGH